MAGFRRGPGVPFGTSFTTGSATSPRGYRSRPAPLHATPFSSAFAGHTLMCPTCKIALASHGHRYTCEKCTGVFVENGALVELMNEMREEPWELPPAEGAPGERVCPVCAAAMTSERLDGIELDRCPPHGLWFDRDELAASLLQL
jgi:Zn-finger nucleic acid-binding protein